MVLASSLVLTGCAVALVYSTLVVEIKDQRTTMREALDKEMAFVISAMSGPAVVGDYAVIEQMLKAGARQPLIAKIGWTDSTGHPIAAAGPEIGSAAPGWFAQWVDLPFIDRSEAIVVGQERYGTFFLRLSPTVAINKLWRGFLQKLSIFLFAAAMSLGVTLVVLRQGLRPLQTLAASARRFGQGDYSVRIPGDGPRETALCIQAFNSMAENIDSLLASLRRTEEKNRLLALQVEQSSDAILTSDQHGIITSWNRGAARLYGYSAEEAIGTPLQRLDLWHGRGGDGPGDATPSSFEADAKTRSGARVEVAVVGTPLLDAEGRSLGELSLVHDISALKRKEAAAEAANRAKSDFLATMSHEIRTPMNGVIGMTALLLDTPLSAEQREYAETVRRSAEALLAIINDILDFSKIDAGRLELEPLPFALRDAVGEALKTLAPLAHAKGLELAYDIRPDVPDDLIADTGRLRQILLNLVGNAIKFTEQGEVAVQVEAQTVTPTAVTLRVAVRDTGIGIPADKCDLIFDAFAQADASTTRRFGGTGLGLAISRRLVERMGGRIGVESIVGRGSTFHFTVSLARSPEPVARHVAAPPRALRGLPVLAVDDNATNRRLLEAMLAGWGVAATVVADGRSAIAALEQARASGRSYRLVLLDARMPDLNGFAVAERIRQEPGLADVTVMLLTSDVASGDLARCRKLGIARHLVKPLTPSELLDAVLLALGESVEPETAAVPDRAPALSRRLRVLVVEDNAVNQMLIVRLLERLGHELVVRDNGQQAVEAYEAETFDLVLMDLQMPVMDGLTATTMIRQHEVRHPDRKRLPIIAVTAAAMRGDRERCLAAGMDDYLTKPIKPDDLTAMLTRLFPDLAAPTARIDPANSAPERTFDLTTALAYVDGDRALLDELLATFAQDTPVRLQAIRHAATGWEATELIREAHTLKGVLRILGATKAAGLAKDLEAQGRAGDVKGARETVASLTREVEQILSAVVKQ